MKKIAVFCAALCLCAALSGCGSKKILHCDNCGREISVDADSNMTDEWLLYCSECEKELGLDDIVPTGGDILSDAK